MTTSEPEEFGIQPEEVSQALQAIDEAAVADPEYKRRQQERDVALNAEYEFLRGRSHRDLESARRDVELLRDARLYAQTLGEANSPKEQLVVSRKVYDDFLPTEEKTWLTLGALHEVIWGTVAEYEQATAQPKERFRLVRGRCRTILDEVHGAHLDLYDQILKDTNRSYIVEDNPGLTQTALTDYVGARFKYQNKRREAAYREKVEKAIRTFAKNKNIDITAALLSTEES